MRKVNYDQFNRFFDGVLSDATCELCRGKEWAVADKRKFVDFLHQAKIITGLPSKGGSRFNFYEGIVMYCKRCGNSKFIMGDVIENWLKEHGE